jgi:hypothetical protein
MNEFTNLQKIALLLDELNAAELTAVYERCQKLRWKLEEEASKRLFIPTSEGV